MKVTRLMTHPDKAQARLKQLRKEGASMATIHAATGISIGRLHRIERGQTDLIEKATARKILKLKSVAPGAWQDVTGSRRCLQALAAIGYTLTDLGNVDGLPNKENISKIRCGVNQYIRYGYKMAIKEFYETHKDTPAPVTQKTKAAITFARKYGWAPPAAWEGRDMDDPDVSAGEYDELNKQ